MILFIFKIQLIFRIYIFLQLIHITLKIDKLFTWNWVGIF